MTPPTAPTLQWIRPPRQARTQETLERLLDAAEALLAEKRFEDVHITEIASRADTSVAAFYRRFNDKEGLLHALHERLCEEAFATADDALAEALHEELVLLSNHDLLSTFDSDGLRRALVGTWISLMVSGLRRTGCGGHWWAWGCARWLSRHGKTEITINPPN